MTSTTLSSSEALRRLITSYFVSQAIYVVAKLDLAEHFADGPRSAAEIAAVADLHERSVYRLLRALCDAGLFVELELDRFELTAVGQCLRESAPGSMRTAAILFGEEPYRACGDLLATIRTGDTAFDRLFGQGHFEYLAENPGPARTFHQAMTQLTTVVGAALVRSYDFSGIRRLIDVGGGEGHLLAAILDANPHMTGVLFEAPPALPRAHRLLEDAGLADRCEVVAGDFFEAVPEGGDAYLLKSVLHDWDDERSLAILRQCRRVMPDHGRLLIVERVIPPPGGDQFFGRLNDIIMHVVSGGCERTEPEYAALLAASGFQLSRVLPTGSGFHVVEAVVT